MSLLLLLWILSLALAGIALVVMVTLIVRRMILDMLTRRRAAQRKQLMTAILGWLDAEEGAELPVQAGQPLGSRLAMELLQLVRGRDRARLITLMRETGTDAELCARIRSGGAAERIEAARALALFATPETLWALEEGLDDPNPEVRLTVAASLVTLQAAPPLPTLVEKLAIGSIEHSRTLSPIFRELVRNRKSEFVAALSNPEMSEPVLVLLLDALGRTGDYRLIEAVGTLTAHPSMDVRAEALRALGAFGHPAAGPIVLRAFEDPDWQVRAQAAIAAGKIGVTEAAPRLRQLLDDPIWWMRLRAGQALLALGPAGLPLLEAAAAGQGLEAETAATVLAERTQP